MLHAIRSVRISLPLPSYTVRRISGVRFRQAAAEPNQPVKQDNMEKTQNSNERTGDVMSESFGEGYATRSDEEGFGGIYGGNQSLPRPQEDKVIHGSHPDYDKTQGSEVKEKEKGRHQTEPKAKAT